MKEKKKSRTILIVGLILFLAVFVFPRRSGFEQALGPAGVVNLMEQSNTSLNISGQGNLLCFENPSYFIYLSAERGEVSVTSKQGAVAISPGGYVEYSQVQNDYQSLIWKNPDGSFRRSLNYLGYPYFQCQGSRLFLINSQSTGVKEINRDGEVLYEFQYPSILTNAVASCGGETVLGWLDGSIHVLDKLGQEVYLYQPASSRVNVNYALAFSPRGEAFAAVNGLDPQKLLLFVKKNEAFQKPRSIDLTDQLRYEMLLGFSADGKALFVEQESSLAMIRLPGLEPFNLELGGVLIDMAEAAESDLVFAACEYSDQAYRLGMFQKPERFLGMGQSGYKPLSLQVEGDKLYCLFDEYLVSFKIKGRL